MHQNSSFLTRELSSGCALFFLCFSLLRLIASCVISQSDDAPSGKLCEFTRRGAVNEIEGQLLGCWEGKGERNSCCSPPPVKGGRQQLPAQILSRAVHCELCQASFPFSPSQLAPFISHSDHLASNQFLIHSISRLFSIEGHPGSVSCSFINPPDHLSLHFIPPFPSCRFQSCSSAFESGRNRIVRVPERLNVLSSLRLLCSILIPPIQSLQFTARFVSSALFQISSFNYFLSSFRSIWTITWCYIVRCDFRIFLLKADVKLWVLL